ncbi:MAG: DUF1338 domain-containing protein [Flammeovirgaceae bacterium]
MQRAEIFEKLWKEYVALTPSALKIHQLFESKGEKVYNDHIAFRTYNDKRVGIEELSKPFLACGYVAKGEYFFKEKKLYAKHFQHEDPAAPKIFISELKLEECSDFVRNTAKACVDSISKDLLTSGKLIFSGRPWGKPSYATYQQLREESEYAAWMYVYGYCANHFTVNVNMLKSFKTLESVNQFLKDNGFKLNSSGGEIKGTPQELLQQSSTLADMRKTEFVEGIYEVPSCYYEFALRYADANGKLYDGFIAASADKIFESTDLKLQMSM